VRCVGPLRPICAESGVQIPEETIAKALSGDWKEAYLFILKQSLEIYDFYTRQVMACDAQLEQQFSTMKPRWEQPDRSHHAVAKQLCAVNL